MTEKNLLLDHFYFGITQKQLINIIIIIVISSNETGKQQSLQKKNLQKTF